MLLFVFVHDFNLFQMFHTSDGLWEKANSITKKLAKKRQKANNSLSKKIKNLLNQGNS